MTWKQMIEMCELLDSTAVAGAGVAQALRDRGLASVEVVEVAGERGEHRFHPRHAERPVTPISPEL